MRVLISVNLPCLRSSPLSRSVITTTRALTSSRFYSRELDLPVSCALPSVPSASTHPTLEDIAFSAVDVQRVRSIPRSRNQASLIPSPAHPSPWPYRVPHRADDTFVSRCSPPPFSRTQLRSTTNRSANRSQEDFHLLDMAPSRAHEGARPRAPLHDGPAAGAGRPPSNGLICQMEGAWPRAPLHDGLVAGAGRPPSRGRTFQWRGTSCFLL